MAMLIVKSLLLVRPQDLRSFFIVENVKATLQATSEMLANETLVNHYDIKLEGNRLRISGPLSRRTQLQVRLKRTFLAMLFETALNSYIGKPGVLVGWKSDSGNRELYFDFRSCSR